MQPLMETLQIRGKRLVQEVALMTFAVAAETSVKVGLLS
jgi:hypothetical protein